MVYITVKFFNNVSKRTKAIDVFGRKYGYRTLFCGLNVVDDSDFIKIKSINLILDKKKRHTIIVKENLNRISVYINEGLFVACYIRSSTVSDSIYFCDSLFYSLIEIMTKFKNRFDIKDDTRIVMSRFQNDKTLQTIANVTLNFT